MERETEDAGIKIVAELVKIGIANVPSLHPQNLLQVENEALVLPREREFEKAVAGNRLIITTVEVVKIDTKNLGLLPLPTANRHPRVKKEVLVLLRIEREAEAKCPRLKTVAIDANDLCLLPTINHEVGILHQIERNREDLGLKIGVELGKIDADQGHLPTEIRLLAQRDKNTNGSLGKVMHHRNTQVRKRR